MTCIEIGTLEQHQLLFDNTNPNWSPTPEYNLAYIRSQVNYLQNKLNARGFLFVNEIFDVFGFEWTADGQVSGWIRSDGYLIVEAEMIAGSNDIAIKFAPQGVIVGSI